MEDKDIMKQLQNRQAGQPVSNEIRTTLVGKIRDDGVAVKDIAAQFGISTKTIFGWLRTGIATSADGHPRNLVLENNKLKKEIEQLYAMLGRATAEMSRSKK